MCRRHRPLTRNELAEVLWPDAQPASWEVALNALVSKLRVLLKGVRGSPLKVISAFGTYVVEIGDDVWIDRGSAAEAVDSAEALLRAGRWREAWAPSNIAAITARQGFLAGEEGEWIEHERARLHAILVRALDCLSEIWLLNNEPSLALGTTKEVVALEPFREAGFRQLMRVHAALGNRAEALRSYEACRELLATELGAAPSPETRRLHEAIQHASLEVPRQASARTDQEAGPRERSGVPPLARRET
jgi:DNA-binding SARP family transcriptional activator